ncbi:MAG: delta-60 repeat domain-containing protein [Gammaproteobacteria bacterium]|nr:delta-60 repeat domain-containing protein [Gammaproteobacteria bacterium]
MKVMLLTLLTGMFGLLSPALVHAAAGDLDPSFGVNGIVVTEFGAYDIARDAVLQLDGKIVTVGSITTYSADSSNSDFALARYNSDGSLDTSFGVGGKTTLDWGRSDNASAVALQADGKILVAGSSSLYTSSVFDTDYVIARYKHDGSLDPDFGPAGMVRIDFSDLDSFIGMVVQADGKIILGGTSSSQQYQVNGIVLVRLDTHGNLDTSFGSGGRISTDLGRINFPAAIVTRKDGKIVVAATKEDSGTVSAITLLLYNQDGGLDTAFGMGGKAITSVSGYTGALAVQEDGKILVGDGYGFRLTRFNSDGSLDTSFGNSGTAALVSFSEGPSVVSALTILPDGKIVMAGTIENELCFIGCGGDRFVLVRFNTDGGLDKTFGNAGKVMTDIFPSGPYDNVADVPHALILQPDGKIIAVGQAFDIKSPDSWDNAADFALVRYLGDSGLPQPGWWWNEAESGRGFTLEVQGNNLFFGGYLYDSSGRATWYVSGGQMAGITSYSGDLYAYSGGQTLTGSYHAPNPPTPVGTLSLQFSDASHGTLTWPGGTIPIQHYVFGAGEAGFQPENGWWWNETESGRGFSIELQGDRLFIGGYMYDAQGNPVWYVSADKMTTPTQYQGQWLQYANGQTLMGPYQKPTTSGAIGNVSLEFTSHTTATLTLPDGRKVGLTRFRF